MGSLSIALSKYAVIFAILAKLSASTKALCPELRSVNSYCECLGTAERWRCSKYGDECSNKYFEIYPYSLSHNLYYTPKCLNSCEGMYHLNGSRVCMRQCPGQYYQDVSQDKLCSECHPDCTSCFGPSEKNCSACRFARLGRSCVSNCPVGYVLDTSIPPATCIRPEECPGYILNSSCVDQCPPGFYPVNTADPPNCGECNSLCKTCSGPEDNQCLTCSEFRHGSDCVSSCPMNAPFIFKQECFKECPVTKGCETVCGKMLLWNRTCVTDCPRSQPFNLMGVCQTTCPRFQHEKKCVDACPRGRYQDGKDCVEQCPLNKFIDGGSCVHKCKRLSFGRSCRDQCPGKMPQINGTCVQGCPETLYYVNPDDNSCVAICPYVIFREQCVKQCPHNYFPSKDRVCVVCDRMCDGCHGPGPGNCASCEFFNSSGACVTNCSVHSYVYEKTCFHNCPSGTVSLVDDKVCRTQCPNSYFNNRGTCVKLCPSYTFNKTCFDRCPRGTFIMGENKECMKCPQKMPFSFQGNCLDACPDISPYHRKGSSICLEECPLDTTHIPGERICHKLEGSQVTRVCPKITKMYTDDRCKCSDYFAKCKSEGASCDGVYMKITDDCWNGKERCDFGSCLSSCVGLYKIYGTRICVTRCPHGYHDSNRGPWLCFPCHPLCDGCFGPLNSHCSACRFAALGVTCVSKCPTRYLNPKTKHCTDHCPYIIFKQQCLLRCPRGYFRSQNQCSECDNMCDTCHGPGVNNCDSCRHFNNNGICVQQCPKYTYEKMCVDKCPDGTALYSPGKTCLKLCPDDMPFSFHQKCLKICPPESPLHEKGKQLCVGECPQYTAHSPEDTLCRDRCPELRPMKLDGVCVEECPSSKNMTYMETCLTGCPAKTIIKAGTNICIPCPPDRFLYHDDCVSKCPFFSAGEEQRCQENFRMLLIWLSISILFALSLWFYKKRAIDSVKSLKKAKQDKDKILHEVDIEYLEASDVTMDTTGGASDEVNITGNITVPLQSRNETMESLIQCYDNRAPDYSDDIAPKSGKLTPTSMYPRSPISTNRTTYVAQESKTLPDSAAATTGLPFPTKTQIHQEQSGTSNLLPAFQPALSRRFLSGGALPWPTTSSLHSASHAELSLSSDQNDGKVFEYTSPSLHQVKSYDPVTYCCVTTALTANTQRDTTLECLNGIIELHSDQPVGEYKNASSVEPEAESRHTEDDPSYSDSGISKQPPTGKLLTSTGIPDDKEVNMFPDRNSSGTLTSAKTFDPYRQQPVSKKQFNECEQLSGLPQGDINSLVEMKPSGTMSDIPHHNHDLEETFV